MNLFKVNIKAVMLTTKIEQSKKYLLSTSEKEWIPPSFEIDEETDKDIESMLVKKMKQLVFINELELLPQIICFKKNTNNEIDIIYGFLVSYTESLSNCFWIDFNLSEEKPYSTLILEVIQKLR